ncbi:MAG: carotenoid 1,2-hydratase [Beijerinckiaceae bacterium]
MTLARPESPDFGEAVPDGGYAWWYIDGASDDGRHGFTVIAFVGSVFSPYYWWARKQGRGDPENHVAINVALYGETRRWAMTERGRTSLSRTARSFQVGPSSLRWGDDGLIIRIDERCAPLPRRLVGEITLRPAALTGQSLLLDADGRHQWRPYAPVARVHVRFDEPRLAWEGHGYFDSNAGSRMLEEDFVSWDWSRAPTADGARVLYDMRRRDGSAECLALGFDHSGGMERFSAPEAHRLSSGRIWRAERGVRSEPGPPPRVLATLEDTPFYTRSLVETTLQGKRVAGFHESLMLDRLTMLPVRAMLPFRMPRRG